MKLSNLITAASVTTLLILGGCDDDDLDPIQVFDLVFAGDATFQGAHGGQTIAVAVVQTADGSVVETASGTVSATADPSFSFSFNDILDDGESYEIHYWIDSNFGGGAAGVCDPPANDHQWRIELGAATDDVSLTDTHRPTETEAVCSTF